MISVNSFSKYFHMTGWRLGWLVVPPSLVPVLESLAQHLFICPSTIAQHAALPSQSLPGQLLCLTMRGPKTIAHDLDVGERARLQPSRGRDRSRRCLRHGIIGRRSVTIAVASCWRLFLLHVFVVSLR